MVGAVLPPAAGGHVQPLPPPPGPLQGPSSGPVCAVAAEEAEVVLWQRQPLLLPATPSAAAAAGERITLRNARAGDTKDEDEQSLVRQSSRKRKHKAK